MYRTSIFGIVFLVASMIAVEVGISQVLVAQDANMTRTYLLNELTVVAQKSWQERYDTLKTVTDKELPDAGIQWILEQYNVSEPVSLIPTEGLGGWTKPYGAKLPAQSKWINNGGKLILDRSDRTKNDVGGDLVTAKQYGNFILDFAWIATEGCNSGIKFRLKDFGADGAKVNCSKTFGWLGCEYQILDDFNNAEGTKDKGQWSTASLYSVFAPDKEKKHLNPHGQLNTGRIIVLDNYIEHWLNGERVLQYEVSSDSWKTALSQSKYHREDAKAEGFGENSKGFIMLQDHWNTIIFEKIVIREIGEKRYPFHERPMTLSEDVAPTEKTVSLELKENWLLYAEFGKVTAELTVVPSDYKPNTPNLVIP